MALPAALGAFTVSRGGGKGIDVHLSDGVAAARLRIAPAAADVDELRMVVAVENPAAGFSYGSAALAKRVLTRALSAVQAYVQTPQPEMLELAAAVTRRLAVASKANAKIFSVIFGAPVSGGDFCPPITDGTPAASVPLRYGAARREWGQHSPTRGAVSRTRWLPYA